MTAPSLEAAIPFSALAERQPVDEDGLRKVGLLSVQDRLNRRVGDVAEHALLLTLGIDAEAAGCKPEVAVVVKDHGQKILRQLLAERSLAAALMSMSSTFSNSGRTFPALSVARSISTWLLLVGQTMRFSESKNV